MRLCFECLLRAAGCYFVKASRALKAASIRSDGSDIERADPAQRRNGSVWP